MTFYLCPYISYYKWRIQRTNLPDSVTVTVWHFVIRVSLNSSETDRISVRFSTQLNNIWTAVVPFVGLRFNQIRSSEFSAGWTLVETQSLVFYSSSSLLSLSLDLLVYCFVSPSVSVCLVQDVHTVHLFTALSVSAGWGSGWGSRWPFSWATCPLLFFLTSPLNPHHRPSTVLTVESGNYCLFQQTENILT